MVGLLEEKVSKTTTKNNIAQLHFRPSYAAAKLTKIMSIAQFGTVKFDCRLLCASYERENTFFNMAHSELDVVYQLATLLIKFFFSFHIDCVAEKGPN